MTEHRVIVDALNIDYPASRVVNNLSFTLGNERLALVGESGSGKSMSARALMGLVRKPGIVSANRLNVLGNDLLTLNARRWQALRGNGIAMVLQDPRYALNPVKSVAAQLDEALTLHQRLPRPERAARIHDILRAVVPDEQAGIIDERRPVDAVKFVESTAVAGFHPCYQCRIFHFGSG